MMGPCKFCSLANLVRRHERSPSLADQVLGETESFYVLPALGPLVLGHILIVSKDHLYGIRSTKSRVLQAEYEHLVRVLRQACKRRSAPLMELEHGSNAGGTQGPCIDHAHVHLLPSLTNDANVFEGTFPVLTNSRPQKDEPYFWIRTNQNEHLYSADKARRQEPRILLAKRLGLGDTWDWAVFPKYTLIQATIDFWGNHEPWK